MNSLGIDNLRISPANQDGTLDTLVVSSSFSDLHLLEVNIDIEDWKGDLAYNYNKSPLIEAGDSINFTWDGKDSTGNYVPDGSYDIILTVTDKAGNKTIDNSNWVIIDNDPADLSFNPAGGSWFNHSPIEISGQTEPDATLEIRNAQSGQFINAVLDSVGKFVESLDLELGVNQIELSATDQTGNENIQEIDYFREDVAPNIEIASPQELTDERQFTINLNLTDTGYSEYISGVDISSLDLVLNHPDIGELVLVENGTNIEGGNIFENCSSATGVYGNSKAVSCTYSYKLSVPLQPDGNWEIRANVSDVAGNTSETAIKNIELDSHILNEISEPNNGQLFNYSQITLRGTAEKGATLNKFNRPGTS